MIDARKSLNMTQKELSERTGITQADISRIEYGTRNPSLEMVKRLARGMIMVLKLEFKPEAKYGESLGIAWHEIVHMLLVQVSSKIVQDLVQDLAQQTDIATNFRPEKIWYNNIKQKICIDIAVGL